MEEFKKYIKERYQQDYDFYCEKAIKEVGTYVNDYDTHCDTGAILSDNGYYSNEDEISERAKELFIENISSDPLAYIDTEVLANLINEILENN